MLCERPIVIAEGAGDAPEHLVDRRRDLGVLALAEPAGGALEVGEGPIRAACRKGDLGGLVQELSVGRPRAAGRAELECQLAGCERVRGRIAAARPWQLSRVRPLAPVPARRPQASG